MVKARLVDVGYLDLAGCMALGITGPTLRSTGLPHDLRKSQPYCGYETYDFEVQTWDSCDSYGRLRIRINEMKESLKIVEQCVERLRADGPGPGDDRRQEDRLAGPAGHRLRRDGQQPRPHPGDHGHLDGGPDPPLQAGHRGLPGAGRAGLRPVEAPRGELGVHLVSDGGTRPYRAHFRDPSFANLQAMAAMSEGGQIADVIVAVASLDPVMGGVDR